MNVTPSPENVYNTLQLESLLCNADANVECTFALEDQRSVVQVLATDECCGD